jgi:FixJ family two-component response regulator
MTSTRNIYIAIIDDDESVCRAMGRLLRAAQLHSITYSSAESFLLDTKRPKFDCLVLDIQLKGMSGLELNRRLVAIKDATPVIFITAHDDPEVWAQAEAAGCAGLFRKNDAGAEIISAIRRVIGWEESDSASKPEHSIDPE